MRAEDETGDASAERDGVESAPRGEPVTPKTRQHRTGAELESRFDDWAMHRREKIVARTPQEDARLFRRGLAAAMGVGILVIAAGVTGEHYDVTRTQNSVRIVELEKQLAEAEMVAQDTDLAGQVSALTKAAAADAAEVETAQQAFAVLYRRASTQPSPNNGMPNQAMLDIAEHRRTLAALFSESSFLVEDEEAYRWSTATSFDATSEIDPRYAWYVRYDGQDAADPSTYTWGLETVMPDLDSPDASGTTHRAQVVWLCRDAATNEVLAWASARYTYDGTAGVFDEVEVVTTTTGARYQHTTGTPLDAPEVPKIDGLGGQDENSGGN